MKKDDISAQSITALHLDYVNCLACTTVTKASEIRNNRCSHCNALISFRKNNSIEKTWIFLITSIILFFPANLLPITYTSYLGSIPKPDTILSSIILLWHHGSYLIAIVIFIASILTPLFKIAVLLYLLTHNEISKPPVLQTHLYHFIHFIGRWSMIDVFVVALLGALIHGNLAQITPGSGIFAFAAVVIFTMIATECFDIRLIWDKYRAIERINSNYAS